jgi:hypothetical protein
LGLAHSGILVGLPRLDLTGWKLPGQLPFPFSPTDHEYAAVIDDDGRRNSWPGNC